MSSQTLLEGGPQNGELVDVAPDGYVYVGRLETGAYLFRWEPEELDD